MGVDPLPPFTGSLPPELSDLCAILGQLFPDRDRLQDLFPGLPTPTQLPNSGTATELWVEVLGALEEGRRMGVLISILDVVRQADEHRNRPDLFRAVRAYQRRCGLDMGAIASLTDRYVRNLSELSPGTWRSRSEAIAGTVEAAASLRTLTRRFEELARWPIGNEDISRELQVLQQLLDQSHRLLESLRQPRRTLSRRQQALNELARLGRELQAVLGQPSVRDR